MVKTTTNPGIRGAHKALIMRLAWLGALMISFVTGLPGTVPAQTAQTPTTPPESVVKLMIATAGGYLGPPTDHYRVGDQITITITMTNTSKDPVDVCESSGLYQNVPQLTKDGAVVPYMKEQSDLRLAALHDNVCKDENLPEPILLRPNEPELADWMVVVDDPSVTGADGWYDPLPPGKYVLSIQRRLRCCDGPLVQSNQVSFEVRS